MRSSAPRLRKYVAGLALGAVLTGALALSPVTSVPAAGNPTVTATPGSGLLDGQFVEVSWTGFPAGTVASPQGVAVSQCSEHPVAPEKDCALSELGITDTAGSGSLPIPVHTGAVVARDGKSTFTCDENHPCTVGVYSDPSRTFQSGSPAAVRPITFGFPASACPHGGTEGVSGTGGEAVYRAMLRWEAQVCQPPAKLDLQYTRTESSDGKEAFIGDGTTEPPAFAVTSVPFSHEEHGRLEGAKRDVFTAPVSASALVFVFHGTDRVTGQRITDVTLTPAQLAHIFNGSRDSLVAATAEAEDNDILDLNPGVNFRGSLQAFGRLDRAAGTLELTSWMLAAAPNAWKDVPPWVAGRPAASGRPPETVDYQTPTDRLPDGLQGPGAAGQLINGPDNLGLLLAGKGSLGDPVDMNIMGYLDSSTARFYGLTQVCLQLDPSWRTTHTPCVAATPENIAKGLRAAAKRNDDGTITPDLTPADSSAYPIVDVSYLVADVEQDSAAKAETLRSLLRYAVSDGQKPAVLPPGYAPLPADLVAVTHQAADAVTGADPAPPPVQGPPAGGEFAGSGFGGGLLGGGLKAGQATVNAGADNGAKKRVAKVQAVADIHYPKSGNRLSGQASWWVVLALTALCLAGLMAHPTVRQALRAPLDRWPGRGGRGPTEVVSS